MGTIAQDIISFLESAHRPQAKVDIIAALKGVHNNASVGATLSTMVRKRELVQTAARDYRVPNEGEIPPLPPPPKKRKKDSSPAPFLQILAYLQENGPRTKQQLKRVLPEIKQFDRVIEDMIQLQHIHGVGNGTFAAGRNPKAPPLDKKPENRWNAGIPPKDKPKNTPSEEAKREAGASATSEEPETVATPNRAGDAPDESAAKESPAPAIGPAPAFGQSIIDAVPKLSDDTNDRGSLVGEKSSSPLYYCRIISGTTTFEISGRGSETVGAIRAALSQMCPEDAE